MVVHFACRAARRWVNSETGEGPRSKVREEVAQQAAKEGRETGPRDCPVTRTDGF